MLVDDALNRSLSKELTYEVPSNIPGKPMVIKNLSLINGNMPKGMKLVAFPSGRTDLIPSSYTIEDKRSLAPANIKLVDDIELRNSQQEFVDFCDDSCILNAKPGWGKTFTSIAAAAKLGQKTLIITHTVALRSQWEREIIKMTGKKPGVIGSGKFNVDADIVVSNTQSVIKHLPKIKQMFGTVMLDEMHHVSSPTFTKIINSLFCRYKIGMTGTLRRKDGKHVVFEDYFSKKKYVPAQENVMHPHIHVYSPPFIIPEASSWAERVNLLCRDPDYQAYVIWLADKYVKQGHQVLVVSNRVDFLKVCESMSDNRSCRVTGLDDREAAHAKVKKGEVDELWGSISIYSEGISLNSISCVIMAAPINNDVLLEQLLARVNRENPGKQWPVAVDIKFANYTGINQFRTRMEHYRLAAHKVTFVENSA